jgi:hypothetical protein
LPSPPQELQLYHGFFVSITIAFKTLIYDAQLLHFCRKVGRCFKEKLFHGSSRFFCERRATIFSILSSLQEFSRREYSQPTGDHYGLRAKRRIRADHDAH